jgi:hypothetical protein
MLMMFGKRIQLIKILDFGPVSLVVATVWFYCMLIDCRKSGYI